MTTLDRRGLLAGGLTLSGLALTAPGLGARSALRVCLGPRREEGGSGALVLLQLTGGNDGLSTVVPFGEPAYGRARRATRIDESEALSIGDGIGLNPGLVGLQRRFEEGRLAVVQGVGYPDPNRSHFESMDMWHSASPRKRAMRSGWVGRLAEAMLGDDLDPNRVVHIGPQPPFSVYSPTHPAASFENASAYRFAGNSDELSGLAEEQSTETGSDVLRRLRSVFRDASRSSEAIRGAAASYETKVEYPDGPLGRSLRTAAALLKSDIGTRVISLEQTGYDTHNDQRRRHDRLMGELDEALAAFTEDLAGSEVEAGTTIAMFSEFGRRVGENASNGTDHGTAGPMFLVGAGVRGGLFGKAPSLEDLDQEDLIHSTDFRSVYAALIEGVFGLEHERVLGATYPVLPVLSKV